MANTFNACSNLVGTFVKDKDGNVIDEAFPRGTNFLFDGITIIGNLKNVKNKKYDYKVVSYDGGRIVSCFRCSDVERLKNGLYKLTLFNEDEDSYEGKAFLFNPETGRLASRVYDSMGYLKEQKLFLCKDSVRTRRGSFDYYVKVDLNGREVSNLYNYYTEEEVSLEDRVSDEEKTLKLINENDSKKHLKIYSLEPREESKE